MKKLFKKIFYKGIRITEYSGITIKNNIREKVYIEVGKLKVCIDITDIHWVLCLEPIVFGVWLTNEKGHSGLCSMGNNGFKMIFKDQTAERPQMSGSEKILAIVDLDLFEKIEESDGTLLLFKYKKSRLFHTNYFETRFLFSRYYRKPALGLQKFKSLVAAYSYPRKVRIISFKEDDYCNIFPMDLVGQISGGRRYVFGLRHTNQSLSRIIETKKMLVSEVSFVYWDLIYKLGKHHSATLPALNELPFKTSPSKKYGFPVPEFVQKYSEVKILRSINLGSHMLLWGESENEEAITEPDSGFYYIHFLLYLYQKRKGIDYSLV